MPKNHRIKREIIGPPDQESEMVTIHDEKGKILHRIISPLRTKFNPRDIMQVIVGASILAIPVGFTEETWRIAETLPVLNTVIFLIISLLFISIFTYYNYYKHHLKTHSWEFSRRIMLTYCFAFIVVAGLLSIIQVAQWQTDFVVALKRVIIVSFPASMSAAVADMIK